MSLTYPARKFTFTIEGVIGPNPLTDEQLKVFLVGVRNMILSHTQQAVAAVPMTTSINPADITLAPALTLGGQ